MPLAHCAHCAGAIQLPREHESYWRCGVCRKVNGRPAAARGFARGVLRCGLCAFYGSRLTHGAATALLGLIVSSGLGWALPTVARDYGAVRFAVSWAAAVALSAAALGSFFAAARSPPGAVPRRSRDEWARELRALLPADERCGVAAARLPWCAVCDNLKPPRTHHCSTCSACVVRMDHHCGFLHNCVGAGNHGAFLRLLVAVQAGTGFVFAYAALELAATYLASDGRGGDLGRVAMGRALRASRRAGASPSASSSGSSTGRRSTDLLVAVLRVVSASRDGKYALLGCLAFGVFLGVSVLLVVYARLAFCGETSLEQSARLYRRGPDHRTYPRWRGLFEGHPADATPSAVLAELRAAGFFDPDRAHDDVGDREKDE